MRDQGIYADIDIDAYHSEEGISSSGIGLILDCPQRFWYEFMGKPKDDEKEAKKKRDKFKLGRALHMLMLEPEKFEQTFFPMDEEVNLTTKAGKEIYAQAEFQAEGRDIIRYGDWIDIWEMAQSAKAHPVWQQFGNGFVERSIYWNAGIYNTRLRARPDIYNNDLIIDVKTTDSIPNFQRSLYQYGYHRQAAMQIDALRHFNTEGDFHKRFHAFFVIEKKAPYLTACFTLDEASINQGRQEYQDGAATYSECLKANFWPGYDHKFQITSIPQWAMRRDDLTL